MKEVIEDGGCPCGSSAATLSHRRLGMAAAAAMLSPSLFEEPAMGLAARARYSSQLNVTIDAFHSARHADVSRTHRRFDLLGPVGPRCARLERFGRSDEEKRVCGLSAAPAPCVIISLGNNNLWHFEADVALLVGCCCGAVGVAQPQAAVLLVQSERGGGHFVSSKRCPGGLLVVVLRGGSFLRTCLPVRAAVTVGGSGQSEANDCKRLRTSA